MSRLRYSKVREVNSPSRGHDGDAGLDFYMPTDLYIHEFKSKQATNSSLSILTKESTEYRWLSDEYLENDIIEAILIYPHSRVLIPSGIRVLLEPKDSMLTAANKSGKTTKTGLIFGAQIVDSPYTGEIHISLINTSNEPVKIVAGEKLTQFIHIPIYLSKPEEILNRDYDNLAKNWGTRGADGFGSTDDK